MLPIVNAKTVIQEELDRLNEELGESVSDNDYVSAAIAQAQIGILEKILVAL